MNWKLLGTMVTLIGVGASVALGQGTTPTIVQGDYISNVFGNSNFIKNPNAKLNTKDVTFTGSQVVRSATTPLVATSEFNLSLLQNANADWSTRTFDAGMKGQNCEARFTYRGFATATTTAQIIQNSLVVAQLVLTPSTDPRIASINFPCGDLSFGTTFRIAQTTAAMTGTNEIGGIYVGLATNMANVAQAEEVGTAVYQGGTSCGWTKTGGTGTYVSFPAAGGTCNWTSTGAVTPQTKLLKFDAILKPGKYQAILNATVARGTTINNDPKFVLTDGTNYSGTAGPYQDSTTATQAPATFMLNFEVTSTTSKTIELQTMLDNAGLEGKVIAYNDKYYVRFALYRFPSSSELVVKPETQNVFGEISGTGTDTTTTSTSYVTPSGFSPIYPTGRCTNDGTNLACKISTLPPGTYKVDVSLPYFAVAGGSGGQNCWLQVTDNKGAIDAPTAQASSNTSQNDGISSVSRTFTYNSVQTDVIFTVKHKQAGGGAGGSCGIYTSGGKYFTMSVTPLNQPSNSALYVQGPILGAQTGAAISAGYVGELRQTRLTQNGCGTNSAVNDGTSITITPGVWRVVANIDVETSGVISDLLVFVGPQSGNIATWRSSYFNDAWYSDSAAPTYEKRFAMTPPIYVRFDGNNMYRFEDNTWKDAYATTTGTLYAKFYRGFAAAANCYTAIVAERVN